MKKIKELRARINDIKMRANKILAILQEKRTKEEVAELDGYSAKIQEMETELDRHIQFFIGENGEQAWNDANAPDAVPLATVNERKFKSFGEQLKAIYVAAKAAERGESIDPRLAAVGQSSGVDADGGYVVQEDFLADLTASIYDESILFGDTRKVPISSGANRMTFRLPSEGFKETTKGESENTTTRYSVYGGALAYWTEEAEEIEFSKIKLEKTDIELFKLAALMYATDELLEDGTGMAGLINISAGQAIADVLDESIFFGNGVKQPLGILHSSNSNLKSVTPKSATKAISAEDIFNMWVSMRARHRATAKWYINQQLEAQLMGLMLGDKPLYLPAGQIVGTPYATILGRPVIPCEQSPAVGTKGDIIFANLKEYINITKGKLKEASSIHVKFESAQQAFRFIFRAGGKPMRTSLYKAKDKTTLSPFVTLGARTVT